MKINGTTVRGGWSSFTRWGNVNDFKFLLTAKDTFETNGAKVYRTVKKIEDGKITLPAPVSNQNMYYLHADGLITPFK